MSRPALETSASPRFRPTRAKEQTPTVTEGRPTCPRYLSAVARKKFRQLCKQLEQRRALTPGDGELLALAAITHERWLAAIENVAARGAVIISETKDKYEQTVYRERKNPYLLIAQESERQLTGLLDRLGMTPLNRGRVKDLKKEKAKGATEARHRGLYVAPRRKK